MQKKIILTISILLMGLIISGYDKNQEEGLQSLCEEYIDDMLIRGSGAKAQESNQDPRIDIILKGYETEYLTADDSCMVAAVLYEALGDSEYRKEAENHFSRIVKDYSEGGGIDLVRRRSLYYAITSYLNTERTVDYKISGTLIEMVFDMANGLLKSPQADNRDAEINAHVLMIANSVTFSPEYVKLAEYYADSVEDGVKSEFVLHEIKRSKSIIEKKGI